MPAKKLKIVQDNRVTLDKENGAVRSFVGSELVEPAEESDPINEYVSTLQPEVAIEKSPELRRLAIVDHTRDFLEVNKSAFKLDNISLVQPELSETSDTRAVQFQQEYQGVPVYGGCLTVGLRASDNHPYTAHSTIDFMIPESMNSEEIRLDSQGATDVVNKKIRERVRNLVQGEPRLVMYQHRDQGQLLPYNPAARFWNTIAESLQFDGKWYWIWQVPVDTDDPDGNWEVMIDATTGKIITVLDRRRYAMANIFFPDPITSSQKRDLSWNDEEILHKQLQSVKLENLDPPVDGLLKLTGRWVQCVNLKPPKSEPPHSKDDFLFSPKEHSFLYVMAYYWINKLVEYLRKFGVERLNENLKFPIKVDAIGRDLDLMGPEPLGNSRFTVDLTEGPLICFGGGGIPDASDAHVVVHEYGHAMHHFIKSEQNCYEEGFSDFLACVWLDRFNPSQTERTEIFPWDNCSANRWDVNRRLDIYRSFSDPAFGNWNRYAKGCAWGRALWQFFLQIGGQDVDATKREEAADIVVRLYLTMLTTRCCHADVLMLCTGLLGADEVIYNKQYRATMLQVFKAAGIKGLEGL